MQLTKIRTKSNFILYAMSFTLALGVLAGCNSEKRLAKKELKEKTALAIAKLQCIVDDPEAFTLAEMEGETTLVKSWNLTDETVLSLTEQVDEIIAARKEKIRLKKIEETKIMLLALINNEKASEVEMQQGVNSAKSLDLNDAEIDQMIGTLEERINKIRARKQEMDQLNSALKQIANIGQNNPAAANEKIVALLNKFENNDAPVLIIIAREGNIVDYDRPTTIEAYLNYLKDNGTYNVRIENIRKNSFGKITELELIK